VSRERPRQRRRGPGNDAGRPPRPSGQAGAVNRSRPIYEDRRARPRRGPTEYAGRRGPRTARPAPAAEERPALVLPENPREAALRVLHAVDTRNAFSDRLLDGAHARATPARSRGEVSESAPGADTGSRSSPPRASSPACSGACSRASRTTRLPNRR